MKAYVPRCVKCEDIINNHEAMYQGDSNEYCELCGIEFLSKHEDGFYYDPNDEYKEPYFYKIHFDTNDYKEEVMKELLKKSLYEYREVTDAVAKWFEYDARTLRKMLENHHITPETFQAMCSKLDMDIFKNIFIDGGRK